MDLSTTILTKNTLPLVIGMVAIAFFSIYLIDSNVPEWSNTISTLIETNEFDNIGTRTTSQSSLSNNYFSQSKDDIELLHSYATSLLNNNFLIKNYYDSYYAVSSIDLRNPPGVQAGVSTEYSTCFSTAINSLTEMYDSQYSNITTVMDNMFRNVFKSNPTYSQIYIGLESDGFFRTYPYMRADHYPTYQYVCAINNQIVVGYDPRCRGWYQQAKKTTNTIITEPYVDSSSGFVLITLAKSIYVNNTFVGVVAVDISMQSLEDLVLSATVLDNGYTYITDKLGYIVIHPDVLRDRPYHITEVEFDDTTEKNNFDNSIVNTYITINSTTLIQTQFTKHEELWNVSYTPINNTDYIISMVVPYNDVIKPITLMNKIIYNTTTLKTIIIVIIMVVIGCIATYFTKKYAHYITEPLISLIKMLGAISRNDLDYELGNAPPGSIEMTKLHDNFKNLINAIRFGNSAYYSGDMNKAHNNFIQMLGLMQKSKNIRGLGVVYNNLANTLKQMKRPDEALRNFNFAVQNAKEQLKNIDKNSNDHTALIIVLANRLMNKGIFHTDQGEFKEAELLLNESHELHQQAHKKTDDNLLGIIKVTGNICQLYFKTGRINETYQMLDDAYQGALKKNNGAAISYSAMNIGIYYFLLQNYKEAEQWLENVMYNSKLLDVYVQQTCKNYLLQIYQQTAQKGKLAELGSQLMCVGGTKEICFVLDRSGSMSGNQLNICKQSIVNIMNNNMSNTDWMALIVFDNRVDILYSLQEIGGNRQTMTQTISDIRAGGMTAFYDGLAVAIRLLKESPNKFDQWIIALTDGEDNESKNNDKDIIKQLDGTGIDLLTITVGHISNGDKIKKICKSTKQGMLISAKNQNEIDKCFKKAINVVMAGNANMESF